ncbi:beta-N-acetylhexosaminidase [Arsenicibacter rosenii]|uniref:beta-N-acetylhexosaminidase n=1 Tax=Arsenicibacter rosenii TaxID=1750698 RepID=A0A1S2VN52_9BACT|nr:beta-N-acetylhexosaminidase [Arsenicibacter rosenii]OIN59218.1 beta-N-acetylglucosaminidase [Arsenicibacter rosenii]
MKKTFFTLTLGVLLTTRLALAQTADYAILPKPARLDEQKGEFSVGSNLTLVLEKENADVRKLAESLAAQLKASAGISPKIKTGKGGSNSIYFDTEQSDKLGAEGYFLKVSPKQVVITAQEPKGFFYGMQSLLQLMPAEVFSPSVVSTVKWKVPACYIEDKPRYSYRGLHLDVGRHFFPVSFVKKYIDMIALHKMNTFHWHLTEDQGWRIEIKKYPKLTQLGSQRKETMAGRYGDNKYDGTPYGGFYTQDEIREVVRYAQSKYVTIIPEIEMPGHSMAVLTGYPELGSSADKIVPVATKWGVFDDVLFPREETFTFLQDVLTEVMDLFPGQYIHIGGDECPKKQWKESRFCQELMKREGLKDEHELQSYFIRRIDQFITAKGRRMIGWDEILEGGLSPNATVMSWRGTEGGIAAAKQKHDAIMTPGGFCYLDHYQADAKTQPIAIGGFTTLEKAYSYEPTPAELTPDEARHIIGVQGNVWTEYMRIPEYVEYMTFPRAIALAEVGWTEKDRKNVDDFKQRLELHKKRLDYLNLNYFGAPINGKFNYQWPKETAQKK